MKCRGQIFPSPKRWTPHIFKLLESPGQDPLCFSIFMERYEGGITSIIGVCGVL